MKAIALFQKTTMVASFLLIAVQSDAQQKSTFKKAKKIPATNTGKADPVSPVVYKEWNIPKQLKESAVFKIRQADGSYKEELWYVYQVVPSK